MNLEEFLKHSYLKDANILNLSKEELLFYLTFAYFNKEHFDFWKREGRLPENHKELKLVLKRDTLDINKVKEYTGEKIKRFIFRPKNLNEYVGQEKAKEIVKVNVEKVKKIRPVHFLIDGLKGHGKTTLASIISNMLNSVKYEIIASDLTQDKIIEIVNWLNSQDKLPVLFIDEIHNLPNDIVEIFYPIMEDFKIYGKNIRPFVLIGATTEKNILVKNFSPFVDRFQVQITLERYTEQDIYKILEQYHKQMYNGFVVKEEDLKIIAKNCKFTPRIAITLLEDLIIVNDINKVLRMHDIVKEGLTGKDIKILKILYENEKPIGEEALAMMVGLSRNDYKYLHEAYLIEMGYIARCRAGRVILEKGKKVLEEI